MQESSHEDSLFRAAAQLTDNARVAFLDQACAGDVPLRARLEAMLAAHEQPKTALGVPVEPTPLSPKMEGPKEPLGESVGQTIGPYKLLEKLGEGGCGTVYVAEQTHPVRRKVALKLIKLGLDTREVVARFGAERQALALMDHPHIAKVLEAGATDAGRPYFVMELVRGIRITDFCDQAKLGTTARLELFITVCHAIQHAHQKGIIHRDIKPSNILVAFHDDVPAAKVIDFGVAKATGGRLTEATLHTAFDQFVGTPAYMSPEQAEMSGQDVDTRADIYSLGALLYELLTGRTPFDPKELMSHGMDGICRTIREQEPLRPSTKLAGLERAELTTTAKRRSADAPKLIGMLRGDLDWIVMKCLEKDRTRRYATANGLAADIQRYLNQEPVVARPPSAAYRLRKAWRRNKVLMTAVLAVMVSLCLGTVLSVNQALRATRAERATHRLFQAEQQARQTATAAQREAEAEGDRARRSLYATHINLAHQAWQESNLGKLRRLLARCAPEPGKEDLRGWEWRYLWGLARGEESWEVARFAGSVWNVACAETGGCAAVGLYGTGSEQRGGYLYDAGPTRWSNQRAFDTRSLSAVAFLPPQGQLLSNRPDERRRPGISVLETLALREITRLPTTNLVKTMRASPDGRWLASLEVDETLRVWQMDEGSPRWARQLGEPDETEYGRLEFFASGDRLAVGQSDGKVSVWETSTGVQVREFAAHSEGIGALAYVPAAHLLATGSGYTETKIKLWNPETGALARELDGHRAWVSDLALSPDGAWLASASADQTVRLWETRTWTTATTLRGHEDEVYCLAFSADGQRLITGDKEGSVRLWPIPPTPRPPPLRTWREELRSFAISPDGRHLVILGADYVVWNLETGGKLATLTALRDYRAGCLFAEDGRLLVGGRAGKLRAWDLTRNSLSEFDLGSSNAVVPMLSIPGTNLVLVAHETDGDDQLKLWRLTDRQVVRVFPAFPKSVNTLNLSCRGDLALGHFDGSVTLWKAAPTLGETNFLAHRRRLVEVAFTPDGGMLATAGQEGVAKLWDCATGRELATLKGHLKSIFALAISPDGHRLATGGGGAEAVKLWDLRTHQELMTLSAAGWGIFNLEFSPDGNQLVGRDNDGLHVWRAPSWAEIAAAEKQDKAMARPQ